MNSFLNPLMNPNLGAYPMHDADVEPVNQFEGRMGEIWSKDDLTNSLNHLIHICRDGQEGYLQAAEHVKSAWLQGLFQQFSTQREQFATELTHLVASLVRNQLRAQPSRVPYTAHGLICGRRFQAMVGTMRQSLTSVSVVKIQPRMHMKRS